MNTWMWENKNLSDINRELQELIINGTVTTVISMSLVTVEDKHRHGSLHSAILIYK